MHMAGEQRIAAPRQRVWEALNDPEVLRASIPGCQSLDKEGADRFLALVEVKIGPIGARFKGDVSLTDLDPGRGYTITGQGSGGIAGSAKGSARVRLSDDGAGTLIAYEVEAEVGGRMAQLGGPIIDATAKNLSAKFFSRFGEIVSSADQPAPSPAAVPATPGSAPAAAPAPAPAPAPAAIAPRSSSADLPIGWMLAVALGVFAGVLIGQGEGFVGGAWQGLAIGLLVIVVAGTGFEYGRRAAAPTLVLDDAVLRRLIGGAPDSGAKP